MCLKMNGVFFLHLDFQSHRLARWHWNVVSKSLRNRTIADSIMALYYWSSHFSADLYNFLIFSRHICLYITLAEGCGSCELVCVYGIQPDKEGGRIDDLRK